MQVKPTLALISRLKHLLMKMGSNHLDSRTWVSLLECNNWYPRCCSNEVFFDSKKQWANLVWNSYHFLWNVDKCFFDSKYARRLKFTHCETEIQNLFAFKMWVMLMRDLSNISRRFAGLCPKQWIWNLLCHCLFLLCLSQKGFIPLYLMNVALNSTFDCGMQ